MVAGAQPADASSCRDGVRTRRYPFAMDIPTGAIASTKTAVSLIPKARRAYRLFTTFDHTWVDLGGETNASLTAAEVSDAESFLRTREVKALLRVTVATLVSPDSSEREESLKVQATAFSEMARRSTVDTKKSWVKHADAVWSSVTARIVDAVPVSRMAEDVLQDAEKTGEFFSSPLVGQSGSSYFKRLMAAASNIDLIQNAEALVADLTAASTAGRRRPMLGHLDNDIDVDQDAIYVNRHIRMASPSGDRHSGSEIFEGMTFHRTVLLGNPGAGKTTLVNHLAQISGRRKDETENPILIMRCLQYSKEHANKSILEALRGVLESVYGIQCTPESLDAALTLGAIDVVLDGLDEIRNIFARQEFCDRVNRFAIRYPTTSILVTSREIGYARAVLDDKLFAKARLQDFTNTEIREYAVRWFSQMQRPELTEPFMAEVASVMDLAVNPLLLSLLCSLYRATGTIPRKRRTIYKQCADLLFMKWDGSRQIEQQEDYPEFGQRLFEEIARFFWSTPSARNGVESGQLVRLIALYLADYTGTSRPVAETRARDFLDYCAVRAWLLAVVGNERGEPLFGFTHRTFYEFFTAEAFVRDSESPTQVADEIIMAHQLDDTSVLPELLIQSYEEARNRGATSVFKSICAHDDVDLSLVLRLMSTNIRADVRDLGFKLILRRWGRGGDACDSASFNALLQIPPDAREHFVRSYLHGDGEGCTDARGAVLLGWASAVLSGHSLRDRRYWEGAVREALERWRVEVPDPEKRPRAVQHWLIANGTESPGTLGLGFGLIVRAFGESVPGGTLQALYPANASPSSLAIQESVSRYVIDTLGRGGRGSDFVTRSEVRLLSDLIGKIAWPGSIGFPLDATSVAPATIALALLFREADAPVETFDRYLLRFGVNTEHMARIREWNLGRGVKPDDSVGASVMSLKHLWPVWCAKWLTGGLSLCSPIERDRPLPGGFILVGYPWKPPHR